MTPGELEPYTVYDGDLLISSDRELLDYDVIHSFLSSSYWSPDITPEQVRRQIDNSNLAFGLYRLPGLAVGTAMDAPAPRQIGFCRVVTDLTRFAYLADVLITDSEQRQGLGRKLVAAVMQHPELVGIRKWLLATKDAHGVYAKLGFEPLPKPETYMVLKNEDARWV